MNKKKRIDEWKKLFDKDPGYTVWLFSQALGIKLNKKLLRKG